MALQIPESVDLSKYIDTQFYGERPHIRGRRLLVSMVAANAHHNGWSVPELAYQFSISESEVLAALLYYNEHKTVIDAQDAAEKKAWEAMYEQHGEKPQQ